MMILSGIIRKFERRRKEKDEVAAQAPESPMTESQLAETQLSETQMPEAQQSETQLSEAGEIVEKDLSIV